MRQPTSATYASRRRHDDTTTRPDDSRGERHATSTCDIDMTERGMRIGMCCTGVMLHGCNARQARNVPILRDNQNNQKKYLYAIIIPKKGYYQDNQLKY